MKKGKKLEDGTVVLRKVKKRLPVKLDDHAVAMAGVRLAHLIQKEGEQITLVKAEKKRLDETVNDITAEIAKEADSIRTGTVEGDVEVEVRADFARSFAEYVRLDTGETIEKRTLTDDERQQKMVFDDEAADDAIEKGDVPAIDVKKIAEGGDEPPDAA